MTWRAASPKKKTRHRMTPGLSTLCRRKKETKVRNYSQNSTARIDLGLDNPPGNGTLPWATLAKATANGPDWPNRAAFLAGHLATHLLATSGEGILAS